MGPADDGGSHGITPCFRRCGRSRRLCDAPDRATAASLEDCAQERWYKLVRSNRRRSMHRERDARTGLLTLATGNAATVQCRSARRGDAGAPAQQRSERSTAMSELAHRDWSAPPSPRSMTLGRERQSKTNHDRCQTDHPPHGTTGNRDVPQEPRERACTRLTGHMDGTRHGTLVIRAAERALRLRTLRRTSARTSTRRPRHSVAAALANARRVGLHRTSPATWLSLLGHSPRRSPTLGCALVEESYGGGAVAVAAPLAG